MSISLLLLGRARATTGELGLLIDSSGSISNTDFAIRNGSLASALQNPWLLSAIDTSPQQLALAALQFSGPGQVELSAPWRIIANRGDALDIAGAINAMPRAFSGATDLDSALIVSSLMAANNGIDGDRVGLVVLGDGATSADGSGRDFALANGVKSITAWALDDSTGYSSNVIAGPAGSLALIDDPANYGQLLGEALFRYFNSPGNTATASINGVGRSLLTSSRASFGDIESRLTRIRYSRPRSPAPIVRSPTSFDGFDDLSSKVRAAEWELFGSITAGFSNGNDAGTQIFGIPVLSEAGHESRFGNLTAGAEARFGRNFWVGAALLGQESDISLSSVGKADTSSWGMVAYAATVQKTPVDGLSFHLDLMGGWMDHEFQLSRFAGANTQVGRGDGDTALGRISAGLQIVQGPVTHGPDLSLELLRGGLDPFADSAGVGYARTRFESTVLRLGYGASLHLSYAGIPIRFFGNTGWAHEFEDSQLRPTGSTLGAATTDVWNLSLGIGAQISDEWNLQFVGENAMGAGFDMQVFSFGVSRSF